MAQLFVLIQQSLELDYKCFYFPHRNNQQTKDDVKLLELHICHSCTRQAVMCKVTTQVTSKRIWESVQKGHAN